MRWTAICCWLYFRKLCDLIFCWFLLQRLFPQNLVTDVALKDQRHISRTSTPSKVELSVTLVNEFHPLNNVKKNSIFTWCGSKVTLLRHCEIRKTLENTSKVPAKIEKKSIFSEMKLAGSLPKKYSSFPLKIGPVF